MNAQNERQKIVKRNDVSYVAMNSDKLLKNHRLRHTVHRIGCNRFISHHALHNKHRFRPTISKRLIGLRQSECYCNVTKRYSACKYLKSNDNINVKSDLSLNRSLLMKQSTSDIVDDGDNIKRSCDISYEDINSVNRVKSKNCVSLSKPFFVKQNAFKNLVDDDKDEIVETDAHFVNYSDDISLSDQSSISDYSCGCKRTDVEYLHSDAMNKENRNPYSEHPDNSYKNKYFHSCDCDIYCKSVLRRKLANCKERCHRPLKKNYNDLLQKNYRENTFSTYTSPVSSHKKWVKEIADFRRTHWLDCHFSPKINSHELSSQLRDN